MDDQERYKSRKMVSVKQVQKLAQKKYKETTLKNDIGVALLLSISIGMLVLSQNVAAKYDIFIAMNEMFVQTQFKITGTEEYFIGLEDIQLEDEIWQYVDNILYPRLFTDNNHDESVPEAQNNYALWGIRFRVQLMEGLGVNEYSDVQNGIIDFFTGQPNTTILIIPDISRKNEPITKPYGPNVNGTYTDQNNSEATYEFPKYNYLTSAQTRAIDTTGLTQNKYDGSGFIVEIEFGDSKKANATIETMKETFLNANARALFIHTFWYNANYNEFVSLKFLFELLPTGSVLPQVIISSATIYGNGTPRYIFQQILNYGCAVVVLVIAARSIVFMVQMMAGGRLPDKVLFVWYIFDVILASFFLYARAFIIVEFWETETSSLPVAMFTDVIYDFEHLCAAIESGNTMDQIIFLLFSFRILKFVSFSRTLQLLIASLWKSAVEVTSFLVFVLALISAFSVFAWVSFGTYYEEFSDISSSLLFHSVSLFSGRVLVPNAWNPFRVRNIEGHMLAYFIVAFIIRAMWIAIMIHAWHESAHIWRNEKSGSTGSFAKIKAACSLRSSMRCCKTSFKKLCFCFSEKQRFVVPADQDMVLAFTRWQTKSSSLGRFPYLDEDLLAAYLRDDEKLESILLPGGGNPTVADCGVTEEFWNAQSIKDKHRLKQDQIVKWKIERSKKISKILFKKWQSIWTPNDYALKKFEEDKSKEDQKNSGSLQTAADPVQLAIATNSLIELEKDFTHQSEQIWSILSDVQMRQESLEQAAILLKTALSKNISTSDQDEFIGDLSMEEKEKIAIAKKDDALKLLEEAKAAEEA